MCIRDRYCTPFIRKSGNLWAPATITSASNMNFRGLESGVRAWRILLVSIFSALLIYLLEYTTNGKDTKMIVFSWNGNRTPENMRIVPCQTYCLITGKFLLQAFPLLALQLCYNTLNLRPMAKGGTDTPLMIQHNAIKARYHDAILLFRVGDFSETFSQDAICLLYTSRRV